VGIKRDKLIISNEKDRLPRISASVTHVPQKEKAIQIKMVCQISSAPILILKPQTKRKKMVQKSIAIDVKNIGALPL
jgi:hypothetical protein